ncbi:hypothetical protein POM88_036439 [Heracleum sosnowskyi]|uniref:Uncharacterized protein n=1 Tax=Heracleum sosnowskyi TaxID=360622 RepID=A0AAD8HQ71_9APIA|nr:hypothetical protein POM88_036439 [Heracleum sosnowskyi]
MKRFEEQRVIPDCRNAGNPAHRCSDYCYTVIAEAKKRLSKEEAANHKLRVIPGMLDRREMLMCLSKREVNSPKDRVTKRNKVVADGDSDSTAIEAKKPKSSVTSILANVPLEENERSQGCLGEGPYRLDSLKAFQDKMDLVFQFHWFGVIFFAFLCS